MNLLRSAWRHWPEGDRRHFLIVAGISILLTAVTLPFGFNAYDEGDVLGHTWRTYLGEIPYLDFTMQYAPLRVYPAVWLWSIFGENIFVHRGLWAMMRILTPVFLFLAARRILPAPWPLTAGLIIAVAPGPLAKASVGLAAVLPLFAIVRMVERPRPNRILTAGLLCALAVYLRRDMAAYASVGLLAGLLVARGVVPLSPGVLGGRGIVAGMGFLIGLLPGAGWLAHRPGLASGAWYSLVEFLAVQKADRVRTIPLPWPTAETLGGSASPGTDTAFMQAAYTVLDLPWHILAVAVPALVLAGVWRYGLTRSSESFTPAARAQTQAACALAAGGVIFYWMQTDLPHLLQALPALGIVFALACSKFVAWVGRPALARMAPVLLVGAFAYTATWLDYWTDSTAGGSVGMIPRKTQVLDIPGVPVRVRPAEAELLERATAAVARHSAPDGAVFTADHSFFVFGARRRPATSVGFYLGRGPADDISARDKLEMADLHRLRRLEADVVVMTTPAIFHRAWPMLARHVWTHYSVAERHSWITILTRVDSAPTPRTSP